MRVARAEQTDTQRFWVALAKAGEDGLHSHDVRSAGISGNPAQRAKDCVDKGQAVFTARENRGKRPGSRYWLSEYAPDWAIPVRPNHGAEGDDGISSDASVTDDARPAVVALNPEPCAFSTHRVSDWRKPGGRWTCGICHAPALDESRIERREPLQEAA